MRGTSRVELPDVVVPHDAGSPGTFAGGVNGHRLACKGLPSALPAGAPGQGSACGALCRKVASEGI